MSDESRTVPLAGPAPLDRAGLLRLLEDLRRFGPEWMSGGMTQPPVVAPDEASGGQPGAIGGGPTTPPPPAADPDGPAVTPPTPTPTPTVPPVGDRPETVPPGPSGGITAPTADTPRPSPGGPGAQPQPAAHPISPVVAAPPDGSSGGQASGPAPSTPQAGPAGGAAASPQTSPTGSVADAGPARQPGGPTAATRPLGGTADPDLPTTVRGGPRPSPGGVSARSQQATGSRPDVGGLPDGALLRRFAGDRDQAAFTELVRRHGRPVLAVCTRVLGDPDLAWDASQATFLALSRRAAGLDARDSLAGWLYKVAYRMALRYRVAAARQRRVERAAAQRDPRDADRVFVGIEEEEVFRVLREELQRLPEKYRVPLALCYLEGRTHAEVARAVGLPRGSVAKRIGEGLGRLREGLAGRGFLL